MKTKQSLAAALAAACLMTGCAYNPMVAVYHNNERIASDTNSYNLDSVDQTSENGRFTANVERMEGMDTIWVFDTEEEVDLDITYTLDVASGKLKLVLISPDGDVVTIAECDSEMSEPALATLNLEKGNNRIKIVAGQNTKFDIDLSIPEGEFKKLG